MLLELLIVIMSTAAFLASTASLALSIYTKVTLEVTLKAIIAKELYSAKEDLIGVEHRLEGLMDKKINDSMNHMREITQGDTVDFFEAISEKQGNVMGGMPGSFGTLGQ